VLVSTTWVRVRTIHSFELPKGGYVPVTRSADHGLAATPGTSRPVSRSKSWTIGGVATVVIALTATCGFADRARLSPSPFCPWRT
jgi:hypothetical protein